MLQKITFFCAVLLSSLLPASMQAQCPINVAPTFPSGCVSQYFTAISASGTGVVSTISYSAGSCIGIYFNNFATQGITAPTGSTVNFSISRSTGYFTYLGVYVDWNNNGTYEPSELAGTIMGLAASTPSTVYSFTLPLIGIVTNTNLHMRVFIGEPPSSGGPLSSINPPCSAKWGEACDYYLNATCTTPTIAVTPPTPGVCPGGNITLTASGAGTTPTYTWSPATGLSTAVGATVTSTPAATTTYTVTGYGPGVCLTTSPVTLTVYPAVVPVITAGGPTSFCPGGSVTLSETSGTATLYQWYDGAGAIAGATNSSYIATPAATTTYSVTATSAGGCSGGTSTTVTVLAKPTAAITPAGPTTVCAPATVVLNANFSAGYTYRWFNASGLITGAMAQSYTATATGTFSVEITAPTGCKDTSAAVSITINPKPLASATASGPLTFCANTNVTLTAATTPGYTYQWYDGTTPVAGATNAAYTTSVVGTHDYRVKVTNSFGCSDTTASGLFPVVVNPMPVATITASGSLSFCTGGNVVLSVPVVAGYTYQWFYGATVASATPAPGGGAATYTATATGYYYVKVTSPAGCSTTGPAVLATSVTLPHILYHTPLTLCWGNNVELSLGISSSASGIVYQWMRNSNNIPGANATIYNAYDAGVYTCLVNVSGGCIGTTPPVTVVVNPLPNPVIHYYAGSLWTSSAYTSYQWYRNLAIIPGAIAYSTAAATTGNYSVLVTDINGCISQSPVFPLDAHTLAVGQPSVQAMPTIYPNPATNKVHVNYPEQLRIVIAGIDGKRLIDIPTANEADLSQLSSGIYIITLFDSEGNRLLTEKLVKE